MKNYFEQNSPLLYDEPSPLPRKTEINLFIDEIISGKAVEELWTDGRFTDRDSYSNFGDNYFGLVFDQIRRLEGATIIDSIRRKKYSMKLWLDSYYLLYTENYRTEPSTCETTIFFTKERISFTSKGEIARVANIDPPILEKQLTQLIDTFIKGKDRQG